jgi:hypothetical protein
MRSRESSAKIVTMTTTIDPWSLGRLRFAPDCLSRLHGAARETRRARNGRLLDMTLRRLRWFALALIAAAVTTTVQAVERDVAGWEGARWGMNERKIKEAFSSRLLVPLAGEQPAETVLSIPGYVFLGCPFDVSFRFAGARGLVRINLTEVGNLLGHHGNGIPGYGAACKLIDYRLEDMFGPGEARGAVKSWAFPSADVTSGGADAGRAHVTFARHVDTQQKA